MRKSAVCFYFLIFLISCWFVISCVFWIGRGFFGIFIKNDLNSFSQNSFSQNSFRWFLRFFAWGTLKITGIEVEVTGLENLESSQPCVYVGNHQSGLDLAIFGSICPRNMVAVGKKEVFWIPLFGFMFWASGNILIDRKNRDQAVSRLSAAVQIIRTKKISVSILPEGTRNRSGKGILPFKKGAFHLAIEAKVPIVCVVASPLAEVFNWEKRIMNGGRVCIRILPAIETKDLTAADVDRLSDQVRELIVQTYEKGIYS